MNTVDLLTPPMTPPVIWPVEALYPIPGEPVSIFGYNHVAWARESVQTLRDAIVHCGLVASYNTAERMISSGAVRVNGRKCVLRNTILSQLDALPNLDAIVIEVGRYNFGIIEFCD